MIETENGRTWEYVSEDQSNRKVWARSRIGSVRAETDIEKGSHDNETAVKQRDRIDSSAVARGELFATELVAGSVRSSGVVQMSNQSMKAKNGRPPMCWL